MSSLIKNLFFFLLCIGFLTLGIELSIENQIFSIKTRLKIQCTKFHCEKSSAILRSSRVRSGGSTEHGQYVLHERGASGPQQHGAAHVLLPGVCRRRRCAGR